MINNVKQLGVGITVNFGMDLILSKYRASITNTFLLEVS